MRFAIRLLPLFFFITIIAIIFLVDGFSYLELEKIKGVHKELFYYVKNHPVYASLLFLLIYALYAMISVPGLIVFDLLAGYLFGTFFGLVFVLMGATTGALFVFLGTKHLFHEVIANRKPVLLEKIKAGFHKYPGSYLLFLRFFPFFPFGAVNIALAFLEVNLSKFIWTTMVGLLPTTVICTQIGTGLGSMFDQVGPIKAGDFFTIEMILSLVGLGIISLTPILYKKYRREIP